jgi:hypothetical protein
MTALAEISATISSPKIALGLFCDALLAKCWARTHIVMYMRLLVG